MSTAEYAREYYLRHRDDPEWVARRHAVQAAWRRRQKEAGVKWWKNDKDRKDRQLRKIDTVRKKFLSLPKADQIDFLKWARSIFADR